MIQIQICYCMYIRKSCKTDIHLKKVEKLLNLVSFKTTIVSNRDRVFQFIFLFGQIDAEKLKILLLKIIRHRRFYIFWK